MSDGARVGSSYDFFFFYGQWKYLGLCPSCKLSGDILKLFYTPRESIKHVEKYIEKWGIANDIYKYAALILYIKYEIYTKRSGQSYFDLL